MDYLGAVIKYLCCHVSAELILYEQLIFYFIEKNTVFSEIVKYFNYDFFYEVVFSNSKNVLNQIDIAKGIFQMKSHIT